MSVYRLPQGQYGYSGHVVNLSQDVAPLVQSLPRLPSELDVIVVRKEGANKSHRDFRVRRAVVHRALQWQHGNIHSTLLSTDVEKTLWPPCTTWVQGSAHASIRTVQYQGKNRVDCLNFFRSICFLWRWTGKVRRSQVTKSTD